MHDKRGAAGGIHGNSTDEVHGTEGKDVCEGQVVKPNGAKVATVADASEEYPPSRVLL